MHMADGSVAAICNKLQITLAWKYRQSASPQRITTMKQINRRQKVTDNVTGPSTVKALSSAARFNLPRLESFSLSLRLLARSIYSVRSKLKFMKIKVLLPLLLAAFLIPLHAADENNGF